MLTGSTPVYDLVRGEIIKPTADRPLVIPEGAVVVPGARAVTNGKGVEWGLSLATPVIVNGVTYGANAETGERESEASSHRRTDPLRSLLPVLLNLGLSRPGNCRARV